jgi:hypothetical protein
MDTNQRLFVKREGIKRKGLLSEKESPPFSFEINERKYQKRRHDFIAAGLWTVLTGDMHPITIDRTLLRTEASFKTRASDTEVAATIGMPAY